MFYLLLICSCLIVRSEIHFSESLCFIGTSQFISSVHDLTRFCLMWVFTDFNLRTHMWAVFALCFPFYKGKQRANTAHMWVSLAQWRGEIGAFYNNRLTFSKISIFLLLSLSYGSIFFRLDVIKLSLLIISLILRDIIFFNFKKCRKINRKIRVYLFTTIYLLIISKLLEHLWVGSELSVSVVT